MYFAGLDAHSHYVTITVLDKSGTPVVEEAVSTDDKAELIATLAPFRPLEVVVEACSFWPWIHDLLVSEGITFHLAHAKELRAIAHSAQKNDAVDAALLARMLMTGLIPKAYPKSAEQRERARLVRHRAALVQQRSRLVNRIHAQLHQSGLVLARERLLRLATREWIHSVAWPELAPEQRAIVETHFAVIDMLSELLRPLDRRIEREAAQVPAAELLRSIPGIGPFWSLLLTQEILPLERFPRPEHLVSYAGLAPRTRSSGGHTRHGGVPAAANRWVRWALVSAIPTHIAMAPGSHLSEHYEKLKARIGWKTARVAAARKLLRVMYQMLKTGEMWQQNGVRPVTEGANSKGGM